MQDRNPDYDLSFLKIHEVGSISFNLSCFNISSTGPYDPTIHSWPDNSMISIECEFELNGAKVDRGALLVLIGQSFEDAWIDLNYELHLRFASGDELVTIRNGGGFESYQIEWSLAPQKYVAII
jgi:hypothetical protein